MKCAYRYYIIKLTNCQQGYLPKNRLLGDYNASSSFIRVYDDNQDCHVNDALSVENGLINDLNWHNFWIETVEANK